MQSKSSVSGCVDYKNRSSSDRLVPSDSTRKLSRPELVHGESEISDHTKDMQKNLMRQIHEDVINKPNMLVKSKTSTPDSSGDNMTCLEDGISELIKVIIILRTIHSHLLINSN